MKERAITFTGIPSGDYESFVWDVTKEVFKSIKGKEPTEHDEAMFTEERYMIYPSDLIKGLNDETEYEFEILIKPKKVHKQHEKY